MACWEVMATSQRQTSPKASASLARCDHRHDSCCLRGVSSAPCCPLPSLQQGILSATFCRQSSILLARCASRGGVHFSVRKLHAQAELQAALVALSMNGMEQGAIKLLVGNVC